MNSGLCYLFESKANLFFLRTALLFYERWADLYNSFESLSTCNYVYLQVLQTIYLYKRRTIKIEIWHLRVKTLTYLETNIKRR